MSYISNRIKEIRELKKMSQIAFARALGVTSASISNYENGKRHPDYSFLTTLTNVYGINSNWLLTGEGSMFQELIPIPISEKPGKTIRIPIVGEIAAGSPVQIIDDEPLGHLDIPLALLSYPPPYWVFRVAGNSMEPYILTGDLVVCSGCWQGIDINNRIMAFRTADGITLKRLVVVPKQKTSWLMPINHEYIPVPYNKDSEELTMIGILNLSIRKFNHE